MAWRGKGDGKKKPFVQYDFNEDKVVARLRLSSNREYFNDTDYLVQNQTFPDTSSTFTILRMTDLGSLGLVLGMPTRKWLKCTPDAKRS